MGGAHSIVAAVHKSGMDGVCGGGEAACCVKWSHKNRLKYRLATISNLFLEVFPSSAAADVQLVRRCNITPQGQKYREWVVGLITFLFLGQGLIGKFHGIISLLPQFTIPVMM